MSWDVGTDLLYGDLLKVDNWIVAHLYLEVGENGLSLLCGRLHVLMMTHVATARPGSGRVRPSPRPPGLATGHRRQLSSSQ